MGLEYRLPEIGRAPVETRAVFEEALGGLVSLLTDKLGDRALATALVIQCMGAVTLARALANEEAQRGVLRAARESIRLLLAHASRGGL